MNDVLEKEIERIAEKYVEFHPAKKDGHRDTVRILVEPHDAQLDDALWHVMSWEPPIDAKFKAECMKDMIRHISSELAEFVVKQAAEVALADAKGSIEMSEMYPAGDANRTQHRMDSHVGKRIEAAILSLVEVKR